jgi:uncharacterized tellurite resistance protein B-like protein
MYIESPVGTTERDRLLEQLQQEMRSTQDRTLALQALDDLAMADGVVTDEERAIITDMKAQIEHANVGLLGQLGRVVRGSMQRRDAALANAPNREEHFEDFIKNKVYYAVQRRLESGDTDLDIQEDRLRKLCLAGGLMARVANVDLEVTDDEAATISESLIAGWGINKEEATFVTEVAVSEISPDMDYYRLSRGFFNATTIEERIQFVKVLFSVADADGFVSSEEIEEIRTIANGLHLTHKQFINAKLTIPRERRAN